MSVETENFWDSLSVAEAEFSNKAMRELELLSWAQSLIRIIHTNGGLTRANMAFLFELRFALALHRAGVTPEYEKLGEGSSTLDFGFTFGDQPWRVELMRLLETQAVRNATRTSVGEDGVTWSERQLSTYAEDRRESEEGETVQAVQRICQKCERDGQPYKFPVPGDALNVLLVDFRTSVHGGDIHDRIHVGLGGEFVSDEVYRRYWEGRLITGVFHPQTPVRGADHMRSRVHFLGFVNEESYTDGEFAGATQLISNPQLFSDAAQANAALANWPLQPAFLINSR